MDATAIIVAITGSLGLVAVAALAYLPIRQNNQREEREAARREAEAQRQQQIESAVREAAGGIKGVGQEIISLNGKVDGNLTTMVENARALGEAVAEIKALKMAAELAIQTALELAEAQRTTAALEGRAEGAAVERVIAEEKAETTATAAQAADRQQAAAERQNVAADKQMEAAASTQAILSEVGEQPPDDPEEEKPDA